MMGTEEDRDDNGEMDGVTRRIWLHRELLRIEHHWTDQVQHQQSRIAAILAVNGFLLAFLSAGGLQVNASNDLKAVRGWYLYPFSACVVLLSAALAFGVLALLPRIPIGGQSENKGWFQKTFLSVKKTPDLWLNSRAVLDSFSGASDLASFAESLDRSCESVAANAKFNLDHRDALAWRRMMMHWELALILLSLLVLIVSVVGWAFHVL